MRSHEDHATLEYRATLLQLMEADARHILEVGCGDGSLARLYKQIAPDCHYVGVERHLETARSAARHLDRVVVGAVESLDLQQFGLEPGTIDSIIYNRVFEDATDPKELLQRHGAWLKPGGTIVASFPNVQYWQTLRSLLRGRWGDDSALARGYRQWFSLDRIREMFAGAGLHLCDVVKLENGDGDSEEFQQQLSEFVQALPLDGDRAVCDTATSEYVVRAVASMAPPRQLLIQTLLLSTIASDRVRVYQPDLLSRTIPGVRTISQVKAADLSVGRPGEDKVFVWQRDRWTLSHAIAVQQPLLSLGYLTVAEIDDDPRFWAEHVNNNFILFRSCHCIQTSTDPLAEFLRQFNPYVRVFPNQLPVLPPPRTYQDDLPVTLFFGALNREADWAEIMPALNRVLARCERRVCVRVIYDRAFFEALETPHKTFEPLCTYERYHQILHQCDVAILPLLPTQFNQMKSDLKWLECAGHGVAVLASPTVYDRSIVEGKTGSIYRSTTEFAFKLHQLIERGDVRRSIAANAYQWVKENRLLCGHYRQRYHWYLEMRDRLPLLTAALRDRVPELFNASSG
ncbi:methyltransferase domain-containing protein [Oscillatoriales cyanobacterium LEGE 11467]|uniref:Methyltransferase domain-containing protein n=1 Tax=Zarconia navalis LEGE 11467 TaxID=1828826 RepID=A0A928VZC5_9CYAN|nr:methyltransferase domain-containing protein [Zarconia navalis]MBE9040440.1 methyltransferase domain-containing protein [Zarconia navalis LEGE 11467]